MNPIRDDDHEAIYLEDLCVLDRRGKLSAPEQRRLQIALSASETLPTAHQLGKDFDDLSTDCADDATLIDGLVANTQARYGRPKALSSVHRARTVLTTVVVSSMFLLSAAAGATLWPYAQRLVLRDEHHGTERRRTASTQRRAFLE